jgi:SAM-dependent methyltransferase
MSGGDRSTLEWYTHQAAAYADYAGAAGCLALDRFAAMLPAGGEVLDFGCGSGWAADRLNGAGFRACALDASPGLAEEARRRYGVEVTLGPFEDLEDVEAYDGVWAAFSLLHDSRAAVPGHLARLHRALRPHGVLYLGLKEGEGESRDSLGRLYTYFREPEVHGLLEVAGFSVLASETEPSTGYDGAAVNALHVFARRSRLCPA